ncbi:MAG: hypothetical protein HHJ16_10385 [Polaromonas sp.]|uniref:hypothetical protein n=1 Tax=Polaromonas sp. TaxID=1869339 RepID=UPI001822C0BC|nr:hypothetical protein [Polaromonas sp.]NMM10670.1 hypothetical protein [Polaromonas sp.]
MTKFSFKPASVLLLVVAVLAGSTYAQSISAADTPVKTKMKKGGKTTPNRHGTKIKFMPGSEETPQQRSLRLKRECKGRVNAGTCEGYTR